MKHANHIRFTIPEPCSVPWQSMQPVDELRRHCDSCRSVVIDFRKMSDDELVSFFSRPRGKVCGRLLHSQMDRPMRALPQRNVKAHWWKTLLLLPLALFSKQAKAQYQYARASVTGDTAALAMVQADSMAVPDTAAVAKAAIDTSQVVKFVALNDSAYKYAWYPGVVTVKLDSLYWITTITSSGGAIVPMISPFIEFPQVVEITVMPDKPIFDFGPRSYPWCIGDFGIAPVPPDYTSWWTGSLGYLLWAISGKPQAPETVLAASTPAAPRPGPEKSTSGQTPGLLPSERKRFFGKA